MNKLCAKLLFTGLFVFGVTTMSAAFGEVKFGGLTARQAFPDEKVGALVEAASRGDLKQVDALLQAGANINAVGVQGISPLIWVLAAHNKQGVEHLLKAGADPNQNTMEKDESAMSLAAGGNDPEILEMLLKRGGNPNLTGPRDQAVLQIAALYSERRRENVRLLLKYGADINGHTEFGQTAAHKAVSAGDFELVAYLLEQGFNYKLQEFAKGVEIRQVPRNSEQYQWKQKVIEMLKARGVKFPAFIRGKGPPPPPPR